MDAKGRVGVGGAPRSIHPCCASLAGWPCPPLVHSDVCRVCFQYTLRVCAQFNRHAANAKGGNHDGQQRGRAKDIRDRDPVEVDRILLSHLPGHGVNNSHRRDNAPGHHHEEAGSDLSIDRSINIPI